MLLKNTKLDRSRFFPEVLQVVPTDDFKVYAYMNDGSVHLYDVKPLMNSGLFLEKLSDIKVFKEKITVIGHTIAWDLIGNRDEQNCIDIDPFDVFNSDIVPDPFEGC
ncbi:MAG: DUF2442 domain-containing protein [Candidatus Riflebacteria bacterium]|nr:DUF2442 domain-containing protein [Candidatus Riflebacteria bacterium]